MKILVISAYRGIGDLIFHLPLFRYLSKKYKTKINLITVHNTKAKYILKKEETISKIIYGDFNRQQILKKIINLTSEINKFKSDLAVLTAPSKRLRASLIISNAKKKIYFSKLNEKDLSKYVYKETKKQFQISKLEKNYKLNLNISSNKNNKKNIFLNIDSFHNQNNWGQKNYLKLISGLLKKNYKLFINFSPRNKKKFNLILKKLNNKSKVNFTYNKNFNEVLKIIQRCNYIIGNESGPICIGAALRKKVLSIYNPLTTPKSSKIIYKKIKYINSRNVNSKSIQKKILKFLN
jgi:ADP-heptose:LPS heptosyltransferase